MDVSLKDITPVEKEVSIFATPEELLPHFEEAYLRYRDSAELKGFRKGKAPISMIKKVYGEGIVYNTLDRIAAEFYRQAMADRNISPIGEPVITDMDYKPENGLNVTIKYEILPDFTLADYKGVEAEKLNHEITEEEITSELERVRRVNSTLAPVDRADGTNYLVTADIQEVDESGTPLIGRTSKGAKFFLGDESVHPLIREKLTKAESGMTIRVVAPADGDHPPLSIDVTVGEIKRVDLPEFNDELVKKITKGKTETAEAFRQEMKDHLTRFWEDRSRSRLIDELVARIVARHEVTVPEAIIRGYTDSLIDDLKERSPGKVLPPDFDEREFREKNRGAVMFRAKWFLIREKIVADAGLAITDAEYEQYAERDAALLGVEKSRLISVYKGSPQTSERMLTEKLYGHIIANAALTERTTKEFF